nr:hypothetical protein [Tanacetum cinerariifolium]GEZ93116.1 hypothetical protein [Tanacetum cinerariifolium]
PHIDKECPLNEEVQQGKRSTMVNLGAPLLSTEVKTLTAEVEMKVEKLEGCKTIFANDGTPLYTPFYYSPKEIKHFSSNSGFSDDEKSKRTEVKTSKIIPEWKSNITKQSSFKNHMRKLFTGLIAQETNGELRFEEVSKIAMDKILRDHWRKSFGNEYDDIEEFKDPDVCRESKENEILGTVLNKLHDEWFKGTDEDDDDLERIIDYLEPTLYDGFIDLNDEEYKEKKCILLGIPYIKPPLI